MELNYEMRRTLRRDLGVGPAVVLEVLAHHDAGDGVEVTARWLATESTMSEKTVRRAINLLTEAGLIKRKNQFRGNRQLANRYFLQYERIGVSRSERLGGQNDRPNTGTTYHQEGMAKESNDQTSNEVLQSLVFPGKFETETREGLRPSAELGLNQESGQAGEGLAASTLHLCPVAGHASRPPEDRPWPWPSPSSDSPTPSVESAINNAMWLVSYFERYVVESTNRQNSAKNRAQIAFVSEGRKRKWFWNAWKLVKSTPVCDVVMLIDWVFNSYEGWLPPAIAECSESPRDLMVTRIRQIEENYDLLVAEMTVGPTHAGERTARTNQPESECRDRPLAGNRVDDFIRAD